jgi:hypothetical protein
MNRRGFLSLGAIAFIPAPAVAYFVPGTHVSLINKALAEGRSVYLSPGAYVLTEPIRVPRGGRLVVRDSVFSLRPL